MRKRRGALNDRAKGPYTFFFGKKTPRQREKGKGDKKRLKKGKEVVSDRKRRLSAREGGLMKEERVRGDKGPGKKDHRRKTGGTL